jgi:hypothetical protein
MSATSASATAGLARDRLGLQLPKGAAMSTPTDDVPEVPNPETGVGIGASEGEPTTFEPEEPTDADEE